MEECLGLARAGAGDDKRRERMLLHGAVRLLTEVRAAEPAECLCLVTIRRVSFVPAQVVLPPVLGGPERDACADERPAEDPRAGIGEEFRQGDTGVRVGEGERGGEVIGQGRADLFGFPGWQQFTHERSCRICSKCV